MSFAIKMSLEQNKNHLTSTVSALLTMNFLSESIANQNQSDEIFLKKKNRNDLNRLAHHVGRIHSVNSTYTR